MAPTNIQTGWFLARALQLSSTQGKINANCASILKLHSCVDLNDNEAALISGTVGGLNEENQCGVVAVSLSLFLFELSAKAFVRPQSV